MVRPFCPPLDALIAKNESFRVLDHGFVRVVDYMGIDASIVQAARVSYGAGTKTLRADEALIRYLLRHGHTSPFEMCEVKLHIKMPIFVARQWIRHRTANVNEYSGRYSEMTDDVYIPDDGWLKECLRRAKDEKTQQGDLFDTSGMSPTEVLSETATQSQDNKQGRGAVVAQDDAQAFIKKMQAAAKASYRVYQHLLGKKSHSVGLARELARIVLPLNIYTQWYWKTDVHNLLHFLALRLHPHAQYEIRVYAQVIYEKILSVWLPMTARAFDDYRLSAVSLSRGQQHVLHALLQGQTPDYDACGLTAREIEELKKIFPF